MTPQEALQIVDQGLGQLSAPRAVHVELAEAVRTLRDAITPAPLEPVASTVEGNGAAVYQS